MILVKEGDFEQRQRGRLIDELPDGATWDDVLYEFYVKKKIDRALEAAEAGDVASHEEAKRRILSK